MKRVTEEERREAQEIQDKIRDKAAEDFAKKMKESEDKRGGDPNEK